MFRGIKNIHSVLQPSSPFISRTFCMHFASERKANEKHCHMVRSVQLELRRWPHACGKPAWMRRTVCFPLRPRGARHTPRLGTCPVRVSVDLPASPTGPELPRMETVLLIALPQHPWEEGFRARVLNAKWSPCEDSAWSISKLFSKKTGACISHNSVRWLKKPCEHSES